MSSMKNISVRLLREEEYPLIEDFCQDENIPMLSPDFSKVVAAIDNETEKVVGIMVAQMQLHVEPIWVKKGYRNGKISKKMCETLEEYLDVLAAASGHNIEVWCQPTNVAVEKICIRHGYEKCEKPLYSTIYNGDRVGYKILDKYLGVVTDLGDMVSDNMVPSEKAEEIEEETLALIRG